MSAAPSTRGPEPTPANDPFFYGWRDVCEKGPDGRTNVTRVPLTREDVLHPMEGDVILHNDPHDDDLSYFKGALRQHLYHDPGAAVFSDLEVVWDAPNIRPHSPDITVIFGVRDRDRYWRSFNVAAEGVRPSLLIEVTSPSTRENDLETKVAQYFRLGVPFYAIVDQTTPWSTESRGLRLLGYRSGPKGYQPVPLDEQGRLWLEPVGLWLAIEGEAPVCYTPEGRRLETYAELVEAREEAEEERDAEARARTDAEAERDAAARARAAAEAERDAEARARADAESRVRQLEEEIRRLRGES